MPEKIAERITWALTNLAVAPTDHLLEIGCGHGQAMALICEQLTTGTITAIDRSEKMIAAASQKNAACIVAGKATLYTADLAEVDFEPAQFDKIFAINVNLFWQQADAELEIMRNWLRPGGAIYLFFEPPTADQTPIISKKLTEILGENRFLVRRVLTKGALIGMIAVPRP